MEVLIKVKALGNLHLESDRNFYIGNIFVLIIRIDYIINKLYFEI